MAATTPKRRKPVTKMNEQELAAETRTFDQEFVADTFGPPTSAARGQLRRAKRKAGRPRIGEGGERLNIMLERGLLARADAYAKREKMNRSQLIAAGLEAILRGRRRRAS